MASNAVSVTLGRDMGGSNTNDDIDAWHAFASERLPGRVSFQVDVDVASPGDVGEDAVFGDDGQRAEVREAIEALWAEWCEQPAS